MSTVYVRDREREREFDDVASVRSARSGAPRHVTTVRRYKYPESDRGDDYRAEETKVVIREKEREVEPEPRERVEYRVVERERERESDTISRRGTERDVRDVRASYRIVERREQSRSPSPENRDREIRIIRERERSPEPVEDRLAPERSPYQLEKYSKSTEYFSRPEPQTIVIRQETPQPIVIREAPPQQQVIIRERSEPSYELIERSEAVEDRQVARREPEEDYYYERRTREIDRPRRHHHHHRHHDEDEYRRHRNDDRDYYSDDDVVYVRRERDADDYYERDRSPHHKRHLAEGVLAGVAAAEVQRQRRKSRGENPGSHLGQLVGYGTLGGLGAEAITRWRNRSRSRDRDDRGRRRSRSRSLSRGKAIAGVAALAGLGALAYAAGKRNSAKNTTIIQEAPVPSVRNVSRGRRYSTSDVDEEYIEEEQIRTEGKHTDPDHRNRRVAQAGLVGAALAGLAERARSRSRGGRSKSRSRIRQGVPIVAAGLGSAAVAGLYERAQARKEEKRAQSIERSRSRSRSVPVSGPRRTTSDNALVEYGDDPIYSNALERRHRSRSRSVGRYSDESISPDRRPRRDRSRSRSRGLAEAAAAAGAAGLAAHEITKRRERRRQREREAERLRTRTMTDVRFGEPSLTRTTGQEEAAAPTGAVYNDNPTFYPQTNTFPPPPSGAGTGYGAPPPGGYVDSAYGSGVPQASMARDQPAYNPAEYGPTHGPTLPPQAQDPYVQEPYARDPYDRRYEDPARGPGPEHVSASARDDAEGRSDPGTSSKTTRRRWPWGNKGSRG